MLNLSSTDRDFLSRIYKSAFLNPFSEARQASDALAIGKTSEGSFVLLDELLVKLNKRLKAILNDKKVIFSNYSAGDARLIEIALLFQILHRHRDGLDSYIKAQINEPNRLLPAECAMVIFNELKSCGINTVSAENYVSIVFQMRRAYFFIANELIGNAKSMCALRMNLWNAIFTYDAQLYFDRFWNRLEDFSTLLLGETGTGKGAAALAIGRSCHIPFNSARGTFSESFAQAFLDINLSVFSENLIESELFGHKKGAFTGATGDHNGIFSRCSKHGAIFLDEIGDISTEVQIKLLRVLQHRLFSPVGGHESLRFGGRIIAATNQNITEKRKKGDFRNDFYYRLSSSHIKLPSLRERLAEDPGELELLLEKILSRLTDSNDCGLTKRISDAIRRDLPADYAWPGNVRELEQAVRSVILTGSYHGENIIPAPLLSDDLSFSRCINGDMTLNELDAWYCARLYKQLGSYGAVAAKVGVDWRTVKQKVEANS